MEHEFSEQDFERFRRLISQAGGCFFGRNRRGQLKAAVNARAQELCIGSLSEYYDYVTGSPGREAELRTLLASLSVRDTDFFRNLPQYDVLRKYVIPDIVRRKSMGSNRRIRLWSAGCSTGQEAYSMAISVLDVLPDASEWKVSILGTDFSEEALAVASSGWFSADEMNGLSQEQRQKYFKSYDGGFAVAEPLRHLVRFVNHNMVTDPMPIEIFGTCDVIFCRNVINYFNHATAKFVVELFYDIINPGGYLFLGQSESLWKMSSKYSLVEMGDAFIYRKSLPRSIDGRRFISDRRMRECPLPANVGSDRRSGVDRRLGAADHFQRGLDQERRGELETSEDSYQQTICCDLSHSLAYFHLASVLERQGKLKSAVREYRNAAESFRREEPGRWLSELNNYDNHSLVSVCEWKILNLGALSA
jgi:chemotaxis protein methyltransferase CheR